MPARRWILILLSVTTVSFLAGCGGSTFNVQNPVSPGQQQSVSIAFQTPPPSSILINAQVPLTAVVSNDPGNEGVDWSLTCPSQNCGTLSSKHSASGDPITYTPPSSFSGNSASVTIVALATADPTKNVLAPITITAFGSVLTGTYVFQASGSDSSGFPYQIAGALALDGTGDTCSGYITSGQQTLNTVSGGSVTTPISGSSGTPCVPGPSSYFVGADGRGSITLVIGQGANAVTETFSLVVLSSSQALIAELDSTGTSAGTLELQDPNAAGTPPTGGYAFVASGTDSSALGIALGGVADIDSQGNIPGTTSLVDTEYQNNTSFYIECAGADSFGGSVSGPGSFGTVTFTLNAARCFPSGTVQLTGYIVDATHIRLIETDGGFLTAGPAVGQGSATGTFTAASFSGPYVFGVLGLDLQDSYPSTLTSLDAVNADGQGDITAGITDTFFQSLDVQVSDQFTANYQMDDKMIGRVHASHFRFDNRHFPTFTPDMTFYLTGNGAPALVLFGASGGYPSLGAGTAYPQAANTQSLSFGNGEAYGIGFTQQNGSENDGTGQITSTLNQGAPGGTLSGVVDDFSNGFGAPVPLAGSFACPQGAASCPDSFGRFSASTFVPDQTNTGVDYYLIDSDHAFFVETDLVNPTNPSGQVALGYFAKRCDVTSATSCQQAAEKSSGRNALKGRHSHRLPGN